MADKQASEQHKRGLQNAFNYRALSINICCKASNLSHSQHNVLTESKRNRKLWENSHYVAAELVELHASAIMWNHNKKRKKSATACALRWFCAESINHLLRVYTELPLGDAINWLSQAKIDWFACSRAIKINFSKREVESLSSTCDCFSYFYSTLRPVLVAAAAEPLFVPCARALLHSCVNSRAWFSPINIANWSALSLSHRLTIKLRPSVKILFSCHAFLLVSFAPACPLLQVFRGGGEKRNNRKKMKLKNSIFFSLFFLIAITSCYGS